MLSKIFSKRALVLVIVVGFVLSLVVFLNLLIRGSSAIIFENAAMVPTREQTNSGLPVSPVGRPVRLKIPVINVDAVVEYVGLAPDGAMDVPKERANVAWFNLGQRPGENGSAVIAGHYGRKNGRGSAFDSLYKLRKGDKLYVEDERGVTISFVVRESRRYDPEAETSSIFGSNDGKSHLNLITCEGTWDNVAQQYAERLVVFTDKE